MMITLKGNNGKTTREIDTNRIPKYSLFNAGDICVFLVDGRVIVIDGSEYNKLEEAMNDPR